MKLRLAVRRKSDFSLGRNGKSAWFLHNSVKKIFIVLTVVFCSTVAYTQGVLKVTATDYKDRDGHLRIGLFNDSDDFPEKAIAGKVVNISGDSTTVVFEGLPSGDYAISIIHDRNRNGKLDTNLFGIPKEGFAFGNNAMGLFGPPSFDKARITLRNETVIQVLILRHF